MVKGWLLTMLFSPFMIRFFQKNQALMMAEGFAWPSYFWMGFIFFFTVLWLCFWFFSILFPMAEGVRFIWVFSFSLLLVCAAFYEAGNVQLKRIRIESPKIPPGSKPIRICQISDLHTGLVTVYHRFEQVIHLIEQSSPDCLVSTGDLFDGFSKGTEREILLLRSLKCPLGKWAVLGNHEFYAGLSHSLSFHEQSGFKLLRNEGVSLAEGIWMGGVDDPVFTLQKGDSEELKLHGLIPRDCFSILLKHRPDLLSLDEAFPDLQLSGHVHGGQLFPFGFLVRLFYPVPVGTLLEYSGRKLYTSFGSGTWGPPMRWMAPPEVVLFELFPESKKSIKQSQ